MADGPRTLCVDIGGTGIKTLVVGRRRQAGLTERLRVDTPRPATPRAVLAAIVGLAKQQGASTALSVGLSRASSAAASPRRLRTCTPTGSASTSTRMLYEGAAASRSRRQRRRHAGPRRRSEGRASSSSSRSGTGFGSALFVDGRLVPNVQLGHHAAWRRQDLRRGARHQGAGEGRRQEVEPPAPQGDRHARGALQLRPALHRRRQREEDHGRPAAARHGRLQRGRACSAGIALWNGKEHDYGVR